MKTYSPIEIEFADYLVRNDCCGTRTLKGWNIAGVQLRPLYNSLNMLDCLYEYSQNWQWEGLSENAGVIIRRDTMLHHLTTHENENNPYD